MSKEEKKVCMISRVGKGTQVTIKFFISQYSSVESILCMYICMFMCMLVCVFLFSSFLVSSKKVLVSTDNVFSVLVT